MLTVHQQENGRFQATNRFHLVLLRRPSLYSQLFQPIFRLKSSPDLKPRAAMLIVGANMSVI